MSNIKIIINIKVKYDNNKVKFCVKYNSSKKIYILESTYGTIIFDKLIGYYNIEQDHNKSMVPTLIIEYQSKLIYYKLDNIFRTIDSLFEKLDELILDSMNLKDILICEGEYAYKEDTCILKYCDKKNKYIIKSTSGILLFDKIIGYQNNNNQDDINDIPMIICEYNSNLIYYKIDDVFTDTFELWDTLNNLIQN